MFVSDMCRLVTYRQKYGRVSPRNPPGFQDPKEGEHDLMLTDEDLMICDFIRC